MFKRSSFRRRRERTSSSSSSASPSSSPATSPSLAKEPATGDVFKHSSTTPMRGRRSRSASSSTSSVPSETDKLSSDATTTAQSGQEEISRKVGGSTGVGRLLTKRVRRCSSFTSSRREAGGEGIPLVYKADLNVVWWVVVLLGFAVRLWRLDHPRYVVFDEVHFGKFASYYIQGTFFFDVHPPLGKMLFALVGYLHGFDGSFLFSKIGIEYPQSVPYMAMRGVSAISGSVLVACVYEIMTELRFSHRAAALASLFVVFDNSLVLQSRVVMLDSLVILFSLASILAYLKFYHQRLRPFSPEWHRRLALTGISLGLLLGVKYSGLLALTCVGLLAAWDLWELLGDRAMSWFTLFCHTLLRGVYLLGLPCLLNLIVFYVHFLVLSNAGPGNAFVSPHFRNSLQGEVDLTPPISISQNSTLLRYGSVMSLRSPDLACWLHSHNHTYPLKYPDGRGSSYQQQVTCYEFRDMNNLWVLRKAGGSNESDESRDSPVYSGDEVEVIHMQTKRLLNSHDVAAPLTPALQEVAGYINYSAQFVPHYRWKLEVFGLQDGDPVFWEHTKTKFKLVHTHSGQFLTSSRKRLPADWGFQQYEVVTDRASFTWWTVDDIRVPGEKKEEKKDVGENGGGDVEKGNSSAVKRKEEEDAIREGLLNRYKARAKASSVSEQNGTRTLSFIEKYSEIQLLMVYAHSNLGDHNFGAAPHTWPMMGRTLPYWLDKQSNAQVTLLGNPVLWWVATFSINVFLCLLCYTLLMRQRKCCDLWIEVFDEWRGSGMMLLLCWLVHYVPYYLLSRVLFLHHYLPALPFKLMLLAAVSDHAHSLAVRYSSQLLLRVFYCAIGVLLITVVISYLTFAPFTYGYPALSAEQIIWRAWVDTWDLLHR